MGRKFFLFSLLIIIFIVGGLFCWNFFNLNENAITESSNILPNNQIYSISKTTRDILENLANVVIVKAYITKEMPSELLGLRYEIKNVLAEYSISAGEYLKIEFINPAGDLRSIGIPKVQFGNAERGVSFAHLGIIVTCQDRSAVIPVIQDTINLEYDLTMAIIKATQKNPKTVAFFISQDEKVFYEKTTKIREDLSKYYTITIINAKNEENIPKSVDTLIVVGPEGVSEKAQYEIDQFIMNGGKVIFLIDTIKLDEKEPTTNPPHQVNHNLDDFFKSYGIRVNNDLVLDRNSATIGVKREFFSFNIPYPYWPKIINKNMSQENPIVRKISSITFPWTSSMELLSDQIKLLGIKGTVLAQTSSHSWIVTDNYNLDPSQKFDPPSETKNIPLAVLISGKFKSFFKNKSAPQMVKESPLNYILIIGNSRMITDGYYFGDFFINSVDCLTLGGDLMSIRPREQMNIKGEMVFSSDDIAVDNSTIIGTARMFVQAMIANDERTLIKINKSLSHEFPTDYLISKFAPDFADRKLSDFKFYLAEEDNAVVVLSRDHKIHHTLIIKKIGKKYYFMGMGK